MTPEGKELGEVIKWLKPRKMSGLLTYQRMALQPGVRRGWPDLEVCLIGGVTLRIEMKKPGGEPSAVQVERINELQSLGHLTGWFDSADEAIAFIRQALAAATIYGESGGFSRDAPIGGAAAEAGRPED